MINQQSANRLVLYLHLRWPHSFNPSSPLRASCKDWISWSHCFCSSWSSSCLLNSQILATPCQCSSWAWHSISCVCRSASAPTEGKHRSTSETLLNSRVPFSSTVLFVKNHLKQVHNTKTGARQIYMTELYFINKMGFCQKQINTKSTWFDLSNAYWRFKHDMSKKIKKSYIDSGPKHLLISPALIYCCCYHQQKIRLSSAFPHFV